MIFLSQLLIYLTSLISKRKWWGFKESDPLSQAYIQVFAILCFNYTVLLLTINLIFDINVFYFIFEYTFFNSIIATLILKIILLFGVPSVIMVLLRRYILKKGIDVYSNLVIKKSTKRKLKIYILLSLSVPLVLFISLVSYTLYM
jgi:hypothetical protein